MPGKPLKYDCLLDEQIPKIVIYKPGYKTERRLFESTTSFLNQEKTIKEKCSINANLEKTYGDKEIWDDYLEFQSQANYPDTAYTKKQLKNILNTLQEGISKLPINNDSVKKKLFKDIEEDREFYLGGAK